MMEEQQSREFFGLLNGECDGTFSTSTTATSASESKIMIAELERLAKQIKAQQIWSPPPATSIAMNTRTLKVLLKHIPAHEAASRIMFGIPIETDDTVADNIVEFRGARHGS